MSTAASVNVALGVIGLPRALSGLKQFESAIGSVAQGGSIGAALGGVGKGLLAVGAVGATAVIGLGTALVTAINPALAFGKTVSAIGAVSGATADEMAQLQAMALALGQDSTLAGIGASDAARAMEELAKSGLSVQDILGGGARAALLLASAGGTSVANAATIAANALQVFHLKGSDMVHVADLISGAANASSISVDDFGYSLAQSGAMAALSGQNFDNLAAAIAIMGNAGIRGADAGTSLKTFLANLIPVTKAQKNAMHSIGLTDRAFVNANGSFKDMSEIAGILHKALSGLSEAQRQQALEAIFGSDAIRAGAILADAGAEGFAKMAAQMGKVTAASVGAKRMDNLAGDLEQLGSSVETARIALGLELAPALRTVVQWVTQLVNAGIPRITAAFKDFREVVGGGIGAGSFGGRLAVGFLLIKDSITNRVIPAVNLLWNTFTGGKSVNGGAIFAALIGGVEKVARWFQIGVDGVVTFKQALDGVWTMNGAGNDFVNMIGRVGNAIGFLGRIWQNFGAGTALRALWELYLLPALTNAWNGITKWVSEKKQPLLDKLGEWKDAFGSWLGDVWEKQLSPALGTLWANLESWFTGTAIPRVQGWGGMLAAAFGHIWTNLGTAPEQDMNKAGSGTGVGLLGMLGGWLTALNNWGVGTALPVIEREIGGLVAGLQSWVASTGYPAIKSALAGLWAAPTMPQGPPIEDIAGNIIPQKGSYGFLADSLNDLMTGLTNWGAGPGHQALVKVMTDLGNWAKTAWDDIFVTKDANGTTGLGAWLNTQSAALAGWLDTQAVPFFAKLKTLYHDFGDFLFGLPAPIRLALGIGSKPANWDTMITPPAGAASGGTPALGGQGNPVNLTINVTTTGPTTEELTQSMATQLYNALHPLLGGGGSSGQFTP